jgi:hypothetical protein
MNINRIRVYAEVYEQGIDLKEYILKINKNLKVENIYSKKGRGSTSHTDSIVEKIRKTKDIDLLLTAIVDDKEIPLLMIEYSTSVPADDHKMQRSDVYYWGSILKVPVLKIYADTKGMDQAFGGGDKITELLEKQVALSKGGILYTIPWEQIDGLDILEVNHDRFSCINESESLKTLLEHLLVTFSNSKDQETYYQNLLREKSSKYDGFKKTNPKDLISPSTRFTWKNDMLIAKINRFGHAMDPDRGVLFFTNMLLGSDKVITEIQVNRDSIESRGGYKSLFDSVSKEIYLREFVEKIISEKNNVFTADDALHVFITALNLENSLKITKIDEFNFKVLDIDLQQYLDESSSMTAKSIFLLTHKIILTDKNRNIICTISWNPRIVEIYLENFRKPIYKITEIKPLEFKDAKEDIITYMSVQLFKKIQAKPIAVSYPGAQGDRAILVGSGRSVKRIYIDIIAYQTTEQKIYVYLHENKEKMSNLGKDVEKLNNIKNNPEQLLGLKNLIEKTESIKEFNDIYIGVGAKNKLNNLTLVDKEIDVDYIFMFDIKNESNFTNIFWQVAIIDTNLVDRFKELKNHEGKLKGFSKLETIYTIKQ